MVDYQFYRNDFGGFRIPEENFTFYERKAAAYINAVTFGRITDDNITDDVRYAVCDAADQYFKAEKNKAVSEGISMERVDDYQISYTNGGTDGVAAAESSLRSSVKFWLGNTGLLYRGDD